MSLITAVFLLRHFSIILPAIRECQRLVVEEILTVCHATAPNSIFFSKIGYLCSSHTGIYLSQRIVMLKMPSKGITANSTMREARMHRTLQRSPHWRVHWACKPRPSNEGKRNLGSTVQHYFKVCQAFG